MQTGKPSYMAQAVARFRAAHQLLDDDPKILDDSLAVRILGPDAEARIRESLEMHQKPFIRKARTLAVLRSRFTEEELLRAVDRGVTQYVLLGAGLDTSPYRLPAELQRLRVFEVDHPDTQRWKLDCLVEAGIAIPANVSFQSVDFEHQSLDTRLRECGYDPAEPTFFSWLGVSYYLHPEPVTDMFEYVAGQAAGSQIVFDFLIDDETLSDAERGEFSKVRAVAKERGGEFFITAFEPSELQDLLLRSGFSEVFYLDHERATQRYLDGRSDGLSIDIALQVMSAIV